MNMHVTVALVAVLILAGTGLASQAFAATTITIETDKNVYDHTDTITITGTVFPVDENEMPVSIMFVNQYNSIIEIAQLDVSGDGSWAIPEFGVIAAMILAVAIVSIIVVTAKTKLSLVPRY